MSTVGVDIGDWTLDRKGRGHQMPNYGPVVFRTWDFGGQKEYYATHQYFLSRRSLYLAVWRITDGRRGLDELHQWLVNIQARAPGSPVILVGTHYDAVGEVREKITIFKIVQLMYTIFFVSSRFLLLSQKNCKNWLENVL